VQVGCALLGILLSLVRGGVADVAGPPAGDAKYLPSPLTIMVGTNEPARSTEPARMVIFSIWAILF
jgi:hypothetical protein